MTIAGPTRRRAIARSGLWLVLWLLLLPVPGVVAQSTSRHAPDTILVRFRSTALPGERAQAHALAGANVRKRFTIVEGLQVVRVPLGMSVKDAIAFYQRLPAVLYAEPNWIVERQVTPNDPRFGELWALNNSGQSGGPRGVEPDDRKQRGRRRGDRLGCRLEPPGPVREHVP